MTEYAIVPATREHAIELALTMRAADRAEVWASSRRLPVEALLFSMENSIESHAGLADGRVICLFGVAAFSLASGRASVWLLTAEELPKHAIRFLRLNKTWLAEVRERFPYLFNFVDARNKNAIRWLRWLGFRIEPAVPFGPDELPFHPFSMGAA